MYRAMIAILILILLIIMVMMIMIIIVIIIIDFIYRGCHETVTNTALIHLGPLC